MNFETFNNHSTYPVETLRSAIKYIRHKFKDHQNIKFQIDKTQNPPVVHFAIAVNKNYHQEAERDGALREISKIFGAPMNNGKLNLRTTNNNQSIYATSFPLSNQNIDALAIAHIAQSFGSNKIKVKDTYNNSLRCYTEIAINATSRDIMETIGVPMNQIDGGSTFPLSADNIKDIFDCHVHGSYRLNELAVDIQKGQYRKDEKIIAFKKTRFQSPAFTNTEKLQSLNNQIKNPHLSQDSRKYLESQRKDVEDFIASKKAKQPQGAIEQQIQQINSSSDLDSNISEDDVVEINPKQLQNNNNVAQILNTGNNLCHRSNLQQINMTDIDLPVLTRSARQKLNITPNEQQKQSLQNRFQEKEQKKEEQKQKQQWNPSNKDAMQIE